MVVEAVYGVLAHSMALLADAGHNLSDVFVLALAWGASTLARRGPSERFTANLADLDQSTLNTVTGQGGNFLSPYYMDQWKAWYEGTTFSLPFTTKAVEAAKTHQLLLEPTK